jgi:hypothetical protein
VPRTTFARQAANRWAVKERLGQRRLAGVPHAPAFALVASFPIPACQFARAYRGRRCRGEAADGQDTLARQPCYGLRLHVRRCGPGLLSRRGLAPANVAEPAAVPALAARTRGQRLGDRNSHAPALAQELAARAGRLLAPERWASRDPWPAGRVRLSRFRSRSDTVFGQLVERYHAQQVWARDSWHLWSRRLRKVLRHTRAVRLTSPAGPPPLQLAHLVTGGETRTAG